MRHKRGSKTRLSPAETSCDRFQLILDSSAVLRISRVFTYYYSEVLLNEVIAGKDEISPSNAHGGMARQKPRSPRWAHAAMHPAAERIAACDSAKRQAGPPGTERICSAECAEKSRPALAGIGTCGKAAPAPAVMLHLRSCYVSKAAILTVPAQPCRPKIEVPLEFQGLGSLGAASWRRFFPCEFDSNKERACGCRRSVRFGSVRSLRNGLVRTGAG